MVPFPSAAARIVGSGVSFPSCRGPGGKRYASLSTHELFELLSPDLPPARRAPVLEHFLELSGIQSRTLSHFPGEPLADDEEDAGTLAIGAGRAALADAGLSAKDIGYVVVASSTSPRWTAALSSIVAGGLGAPSPFLDVRSGCAGGLYALAIGSSLSAGAKRPVLVIGTDTFSKVSPPTERFAVLTNGDGAGALVLDAAEPGSGLGAAAFGGDGANHDLATVKGTLPPKSLDPAAWLLSGDPDEFSRRIGEALARALDHVLAHTEAPPSVTIVHAAHRSLSRKVFEQAKAPGQIFTASVEQHGNLGAASVIVAMHEARAAGLFGPGAQLALASAGGGPSWGGATWTFR